MLQNQRKKVKRLRGCLVNKRPVEPVNARTDCEEEALRARAQPEALQLLEHIVSMKFDAFNRKIYTSELT